MGHVGGAGSVHGPVDRELAHARVGQRNEGVPGSGGPGEQEEGARVRPHPLVTPREGMHRGRVALHANDGQRDRGDEDGEELRELHHRTEPPGKDPIGRFWVKYCHHMTCLIGA